MVPKGRDRAALMAHDPSAMKHYILVHLVKPEEDNRELSLAWRGLLNNLEGTRRIDVKTGRIGDGAWLLDRDNDVTILAHIVHEAEAFHIDCVVKFLSESKD